VVYQIAERVQRRKLAAHDELCLVAHFVPLDQFQIDRPETRRASQEALPRELEAGDLAPEEKMLVLDALATDGLVSRDPAVLPHLDDWSRQALALGPELPTPLGGRGAVLVEVGRYEEGKALLAPLAAASQAGGRWGSNA